MKCRMIGMMTALTLTALAVPARAGLTSFNAFGNLEYTQTANNTAPSGTPSAFFSSALLFSTPGDITSATGLSGGLQLSYLPVAGQNEVLAQTGFITPSQLETGYLAPGTTLLASVNGGNLAGEVVSSAAYGSALFSSAVPYLTGNSYNSLQGLNAAQSDALTFNGFSAVSGANESDIFITITNASTGAVAYSTSFINQPSTTALTLAANTLAAGTTYNLEIDYSSRDNTTGNITGGSVPFTLGYETRTEVGFTTASPAVVPEPSSLMLAGLGLGSAGLIAARRRRARASA